MGRVIGCITEQHDPVLLGSALLVCALAWLVGFRLLARAEQVAPYSLSRRIRLGVASLAIGLGSWATHFMAAMAYDPGVPHGYDLGTTIASAELAVAGAAVGLAGWSREHVRCRLLAGLVLGLSLAAMHFLGMLALRLPGSLRFDPGLSLLAVLAAVAGIGSGLLLGTRHRLAPLLPMLGVAALHLLGIAAGEIIPDGSAPLPAWSLSGAPLAWLVAGLTSFGLLTMLGMVVIDTLREASAQRAEALRLHDLAEASLEGIMICSPDGTIEDANLQACGMTGQPREALLGQPVTRLLPLLGTSRPDWELCRETARETQLLGSGRARLAVAVRTRRVDTAGGPRKVVALRDLSERNAVAARLAEYEAHCPLTGLLRREKLLSGLKTMLGEGCQMTVLVLGVDRMSSVNQAYGASAGDQLLRQLADRLRALAGEGVLLARHAGDEFVLVQLRQPGPAAAEALAGRLLRGLAQPFDLEGARAMVSVSIGIAAAGPGTAGAEALLADAAAAMTRVKQNGRNGFAWFDPEADRAAQHRRALEQDLRQAIGNDQLRLVLQPQASLAENRVIGFEVLLRWHHPEHGMISPAVFIPLAEANGSILAIGRWILGAACREAARWPNPLRVAVNVSAAQLQQPGFAAEVAAVLAETGLPPERLELEVTESLLVEDLATALATLREVKALGIAVAMDDFGTGYSSLASLRAFPFDRLKIDRSFVTDLGRSEQAAAIVRAILGLAHGLGLPVIAEGVEDRTQLGTLMAMGCDEVQGYLIGRPAPAEEWSALTGLAPPDQAAA